MPQLPSFKDFSLTFKSHPITDDLQVVKNENAIKQSVRSLLLTNKGERLFNSDLGTRINDLLFEPIDYATSSLLFDEIQDVLARYEPRINVTTLEVEPNFSDDGYDVELEYSIKGDQKRFTADYFLSRTNI